MDKPATINVCRECDTVVRVEHLKNVQCPVCSTMVQRNVVHFPVNSLISAMCGLLLFFPANFLPLLTFEFFGQNSTNTMINGTAYLFRDGYWWMAWLVLMCSVVLPFLDLLLMVVICGGLLMRRPWRILAGALRLQAHVKEWSMLEVYLIGLLVAYVRMTDMGKVYIGPGFICFVAVFISLFLANYWYDSEYAFAVWERKRS